ARMVGTLLWLNHLEACPMRAPSSTAWPTKRLISQEEMWGNLRARSPSLIARLKGWNEHWDGIRGALERDSGVPLDWTVRPWLFVPEAQAERLRASSAGFGNFPSPRITFLEDVVPWRYRSWNRGAYTDTTP
ncbi:hypothetical protein VWZ37_22810, partial [Xanthomonas citri pv. citri]